MIILGLRFVLLLLLLLVLGPIHILVRAATGRGPIARHFLAIAARIMGLRIERIGGKVPRNSLLVANHVSWLDILAMGAGTGCAFVSKAEVADHWLIKWLADQRETLYIERQRKRGVDAQVAAIQSRFDHYLPFALFPEGTTSDGTQLLPFRSALFKAVTPAPEGAHVIPVALDYGEDAEKIAWKDEPGLENVKRILTRWRPIRCKIRLLEPLPASTDRKAMASEAQARIGRALQSSGTLG